MLTRHLIKGFMSGVVLGLVLISQAKAIEAPSLTQWPVSGSGGWDYLTADVNQSRLYVSRADHVDVFDSNSGTLIATITETAGVHGIAVASDIGRGYVSNGRSNSVTVFDLKTSTRIQDVSIMGQNPDAILYEQSTHQVYTFNGRSQDVTVLDADTLAVKATIKVPGKPEFAQSDEAGHVYLNIETEPGQLVRINSKSLTVDATWPLTGCNSPTGLAMDAAHSRVFSVCDDKVMNVTNTQTGALVAHVEIGQGPDAVAYDAQTHRVYVSNGEGTLSVIEQVDADHYRVRPTIKTERGARTMALDPKLGKIYEITAQYTPGEATAANPHPRPQVVPGSIHLLVINTH
jgi:YVTN family beta-propeller protein